MSPSDRSPVRLSVEWGRLVVSGNGVPLMRATRYINRVLIDVYNDGLGKRTTSSTGIGWRRTPFDIDLDIVMELAQDFRSRDGDTLELVPGLTGVVERAPRMESKVTGDRECVTLAVFSGEPGSVLDDAFIARRLRKRQWVSIESQDHVADDGSAQQWHLVSEPVPLPGRGAMTRPSLDAVGSHLRLVS